MSPMSIAFCPLLATLVVAAPADAAPRLGSAVDLADDRVVPPDADLTATPRPVSDEPFVVFLNYDGVTLEASQADDAAGNASAVCPEVFEPYGEGAKREASIQATRKDWERFNLTLVTERPASGDYTMNVIGLAACGPAGGGAGVAPMDCGNQNPSNVSFTFAAADQDWSADVVATITSQEIAHTFGLDHVNHAPEIMNPVAGTVDDPSFLDQCLPLTGTFFCEEQHLQFCGTRQQNSVQELLDILGPAQPDLEPPVVSITDPQDEQTFDAPSVTVMATASDDVAVASVDLWVDGEDQALPLSAEPYAWTLELADGTYTFEVRARDTSGGVASSEPVTIHVGAIAATGAGDADTGADSEGWDPAGAVPTEDRRTSGCGCTTRPTPTGTGLGLALLAFVSRRRPRRRR